jgi:hypothetical protein
MICVPRDFKPLINDLSSATRHPETARRLILFFAAATLLVGDRTVCAVLRLLHLIEPLNPSTYHRVFSHRRWSAPKFAKIISQFVIDRFCPDGVVRLVGDETVDGHRGKKVGRPAVKGKSLPSPADVGASKKKGKRIKVSWYVGGWRNVEVITGTGGWFKSGKGLVMIRWVYVRDLDGTHRDEYFFSTDTSMTPQAIIEMYGGRWNIETTFQELREHLGLETTRGWSRRTVLRMAPALIVMYTLVATFYDTMP